MTNKKRDHFPYIFSKAGQKMKAVLKSAVKSIIPHDTLNEMRNVLFTYNVKSIEQQYKQAEHQPEFLGLSELDTLFNQHPFPPEYGYGLETLLNRGNYRAKTLLKLDEAQKGKRFLELGCWDGMVSRALHKRGKEAVAQDIRSSGFDQRAIEAGVQFHEMDAGNLTFDDEQFDFVFTFDAFEHFQHPDRVMKEVNRVLKKGGGFYFQFGPLYYSAFGWHAYRSIPIPYLQVLFPSDLLDSYIEENNLKPINYQHVNGWSLDRFRSLWGEYTKSSLTVKQYQEYKYIGHVNMIKKYPSCFKKENLNFDNFIVSHLQGYFIKN